MPEPKMFQDWKRKPKDDPTKGLPQHFLTTAPKKTEKAVSVGERAEQIGDKVTTKILKDPARFLRDLKHIIDYVSNDLRDPKRHGLRGKLQELFDKLYRNREKPELLAEDQNGILESTLFFKDEDSKRPQDDAKAVYDLMTMLSNLFSETHKRASLAEYLRKMAQVILRG